MEVVGRSIIGVMLLFAFVFRRDRVWSLKVAGLFPLTCLSVVAGGLI